MSRAIPPVMAGFFGKIPSRGDFVRGGLPTALVRAFDAWWQAVLPASRDQLGTDWADIWMEAPVWRFHLAPGCCGPGPVLGLWLASTDRVGRLFPLVVAATAPDPDGLGELGGFLDAAEPIALAAVAHDAAPEQLEAAIQGAARPSGVLPAAKASTWWTDGSRLVSQTRRTFTRMPETTTFTAMLRDENAGCHGHPARPV